MKWELFISKNVNNKWLSVINPQKAHKRTVWTIFINMKLVFHTRNYHNYNPIHHVNCKRKKKFLLIFIIAWSCCYEILMINSELKIAVLFIFIASIRWVENMFMSFQSICLVKASQCPKRKFQTVRKFSYCFFLEVEIESLVKVWGGISVEKFFFGQNKSVSMWYFG